MKRFYQKAQLKSSTNTSPDRQSSTRKDDLLILNAYLPLLVLLNIRFEIVGFHFGHFRTARFWLFQAARIMLQILEIAVKDQIVVSVEL